MSTAAARRALPVRAGGAARSRPRLIVITPQQVVGRTPFVLLVGALLLGGLLSLLMLHTLAAQDAFHQTALQQRLANLTDSQQRLEQQVQLDSAPAALRKRATALGMVPSTVIGYHQRPDGRIIAHEVAANSAAAIAAVAEPPASTNPTASKATTAKGSTVKASTAKSAASTSKPPSSTTSTSPKSTSPQPAAHHQRHKASHQ